jgi:hypothetical protein
MKSSELRELLTKAGLPAMLWQFPDADYSPVSMAFVQANWQAWLEARPPELNYSYPVVGSLRRLRPVWVAGAGDCENMALATMAWASTGNALAAVKRKQARGGNAYGVLFYLASPARPENFSVSGAHAINWFVDPYDGLRFFEPAMGEPVDLNTQERSTAWFGIAA